MDNKELLFASGFNVLYSLFCSSQAALGADKSSHYGHMSSEGQSVVMNAGGAEIVTVTEYTSSITPETLGVPPGGRILGLCSSDSTSTFPKERCVIVDNNNSIIKVSLKVTRLDTNATVVLAPDSSWPQYSCVSTTGKLFAYADRGKTIPLKIELP